MRKLVNKTETDIKIYIFYDWLLPSAPTGLISSGRRTARIFAYRLKFTPFKNIFTDCPTIVVLYI
jgi:hypothetical protein